MRDAGPYRPRTNGKAECFIKTQQSEWGHGRAYDDAEAREAALPDWLAIKNEQRLHESLGALPPITGRPLEVA